MADKSFEQPNFDEAYACIPVGMPGASASMLIRDFASDPKLQCKQTISIYLCGSVWSMEPWIAQRQTGTCYPGFEKFLDGARFSAIRQW